MTPNEGLRSGVVSRLKPLTIQGASRDDVIVGPALQDGHEDSDFGGTISNAFVIQSSNVTIRNLTIDGDADGGLAGTQNFRSAIITDSGLGSFGGINLNQLSIRNIFRIGVNFGAGASGSVNSNTFANNSSDLFLGGLAGAISSLSGNSFTGNNWYIQNHSTLNINATGNTFDAASNFQVEDKVLHKMDDGALGLVSWVVNNLYVTDAGTDHSIQHAIDIASSGDTVNVNAGSYTGGLTVNKSALLLGYGAGAIHPYLALASCRAMAGERGFETTPPHELEEHYRQAVRDGQVAAASLVEPWISVAQKWGLRLLVESHSTRSEAAGDDLDGPTLARMFRAQARAVELLEKDALRDSGRSRQSQRAGSGPGS